MKKPWLILGSGPSRATTPVSDEVHVATCNAGFTCPNVKAYGVFEIGAAKAYRQAIKIHRRLPSTMVFVRPDVRDILALDDCSGRPVYAVGKNWGPECLRELHEDVQFAPEEPGVPEFGQHVVWISSGVLMLWIIAEWYKPKQIFVAGLDGYPPMHEGSEYSPGIKRIEGAPVRTQAWCEAMNKRMADAIERITNHYTGTDFYWLAKPRHWRDSWRVKLAEVSYEKAGEGKVSRQHVEFHEAGK